MMAKVPTPLPLAGTYHTSPMGTPDAEFDARWTAWVARGREHEQRVRDRFVIGAGALMTGAAIVVTLLSS